MMAMHERKGSLSIWWFPREFSQSRYGEYQLSGTNSCTLITLVLADKVSKQQHGFHDSPEQLPPCAVDIFGDAMNDGNGVYERTISSIRSHMQQQRCLNLNIPDALNALNKQPALSFRLHEWFYTHLQADLNADSYTRNMALRLAQVFSIGVELFRQGAEERASFLFAAVIADSRTVNFIFEFPVHVVAFYDSHQHGRRAGAVIAQCSFDHIYELVYWYIKMLQEVYRSKPQLYEISFLTSDSQGLPQPEKEDKSES